MRHKPLADGSLQLVLARLGLCPCPVSGPAAVSLPPAEGRTKPRERMPALPLLHLSADSIADVAEIVSWGASCALRDPGAEKALEQNISRDYKD